MITTVAASLAVAIGAVPALNNRGEPLCRSTSVPNAVCCAVDILGTADLDCSTREFFVSTWNQRRSLIHITLLTAAITPNNIADFKNICVSTGKQAKCCAAVLIVRKFYFILVDAVFKPDVT